MSGYLGNDQKKVLMTTKQMKGADETSQHVIEWKTTTIFLSRQREREMSLPVGVEF